MDHQKLSEYIINTQCINRIKVVIVLSCKSERMGELFHNAGTSHVICVKREKEIDDKFCAEFTYVFYFHLFGGDSNCKRNTICNAYKNTINKLKIFSKQKSEVDKLILLVNHEKGKCKDKCIELKHTRQGASNVSNKVQIKSLPDVQPNLEGRFRDCAAIWNILLAKRLVWVYGISGIGKSALVKQLAHILYDRDVFKDGILYISLKDCSLFEQMIDKFYITILESLTSKKTKKEAEKYYDYKHYEKRNSCLSMMLNLEILMIFDDCDLMINHSEANFFEKFIDNILIKVPE
jgi:hypothetical protein